MSTKRFTLIVTVSFTSSERLRTEWFGKSSDRTVSSNTSSNAVRMVLCWRSQCLFSCWSCPRGSPDLREHTRSESNEQNLHHVGQFSRMLTNLHSTSHDRSTYSVDRDYSMRLSVSSTNLREIIRRTFRCRVMSIFSVIRRKSTICLVALLSGARSRKNFAISQKVVDRLQQLFPDEDSCLLPARVLLANAYSSVGDFSKAIGVRRDIDRMASKKKVGLSWTVIDGQVVVRFLLESIVLLSPLIVEQKFRAHDRSHPRSDEIYAEIDRLKQELIDAGHRFDASWITRALNKDENIETVLCGHSERLAIAFNFIAKSAPTRIQVVKNLRVCGDCRTYLRCLSTRHVRFSRSCDQVDCSNSSMHNHCTRCQSDPSFFDRWPMLLW
jgi:hypothetical protein